jgi:hypothetical protein
MRFLTTLSFILFPAIAHAQDAAIAELCAHINAFQQLKEKGAQYVPGVDVNGNSVAPADLSSNRSIINELIVLPIDIDIAGRYGLNLPAGIEIKPNIANIIISSDGHIAYGNEDVTASVKSLCENQKAQMKKNQSNQEEPHGHESANPVLSSDKIEGQYPED